MKSVELKGFDEFIKKLSSAKESLKIVEPQSIDDILAIGKEIAVREAPYKTGKLRSGIRYMIDTDGKSGILISEAPYSYYVNYGTSDTKAVPFFTNAAIVMQIQLYKIVDKNMKLAMNGKLSRNVKDASTGKGKTVGVKSKESKVHKYLYIKYSRSGQKIYVYPKERSGVIKSRGRIYTGKNYKRKFQTS